ncbi:MAG: exodeoxyribonuclease VII large subunit, partial [Pseudomonadota bacterium]
ADRLPRALRGATVEKRRAFAESAAGRFGPALLREAATRRRERLADLARAAAAGLRFAAARADDRRNGVVRRLAAQPARLAARREEARTRVDALAARLARIGPERLARDRDRLDRTARMLASLSHQGVLARGYAILRSEGAVISSAALVAPGAALAIELKDGEVAAVAAGAAGGVARKESKRKSGTKEQTELDL